MTFLGQKIATFKQILMNWIKPLPKKIATLEKSNLRPKKCNFFQIPFITFFEGFHFKDCYWSENSDNSTALWKSWFCKNPDSILDFEFSSKPIQKVT